MPLPPLLRPIAASVQRLAWQTPSPAGVRARKPSPRGKRTARGQTRRWSSEWTSAFAAVALLAVVAQWLGLPAHVSDRIIGPPGRFDLSGIPSVSDGDTLRLGRIRVRLDGIDAPESDQTCVTSAGRRTSCGRTAASYLDALIAGSRIACVSRGQDRYGRTLATCYRETSEGHVDLAREMVAAGWALAYRRYSDRYVLDETIARADNAGLWSMTFETPEDHRRQQRQAGS